MLHGGSWVGFGTCEVNRVLSTPTCMAYGAAFLPPKHFNFAQPKEWPKWICKFECFRDASTLDEKIKQKQVSSYGERSSGYCMILPAHRSRTEVVYD